MSARVLVAEDDPSVRRVARRMLERMGLEVHTVNDGHGALAAVALQMFDIIVLDVEMPSMDGLAAARAIRAREAGRRAPILALTGNDSSLVRERGRAAGIDDFVTKPFTVATLKAALAPWVEAQSSPSGDLPPPSSESFDEGIFAAAMEGGGAQVAELVSLFLGDADLQVRTLSQAVRSAPGTDWRRLGHRLAGSAGMMGAVKLASLARAIEMLDLSEGSRAASLSDALTSELPEVVRQMKAAVTRVN